MLAGRPVVLPPPELAQRSPFVTLTTTVDICNTLAYLLNQADGVGQNETLCDLSPGIDR